MRAILLASATAASLGGLRFSSATSQGDGRPRPRRTCWITAVAPATNRLRKTSSPARAILPSLVFPAGGRGLGGRPRPGPEGPAGGEPRGTGGFFTHGRAPLGPPPRNFAHRPAG